MRKTRRLRNLKHQIEPYIRQLDFKWPQLQPDCYEFTRNIATRDNSFILHVVEKMSESFVRYIRNITRFKEMGAKERVMYAKIRNKLLEEL